MNDRGLGMNGEKTVPKVFPRHPAAIYLTLFLAFPGNALSAGITEMPPGASACSGCHAIDPAVATPAPRLIGRKPDEIIAAITAFRNGQRPATVMDRIAKGFTDAEIRAIAEWYGTKQP